VQQKRREEIRICLTVPDRREIPNNMDETLHKVKKEKCSDFSLACL
jgi:hypothetical protein